MISIALLLVAQSSIAQSQKIIDISKADNKVMVHLKELCTTIGGRPTGSPELQKAEQWAVAKFKSFGYANAQLEKWGDVPVGFQRGPNNSAKMLTPTEATMQFTTNCWMPGTILPVIGRVVIAPKNMLDFAKVKEDLKKAWVLADTPVSMRGANTAAEDAAVRKAIVDADILGFVYGSRNDLLHTHGSWVGKTYANRPKTIEVTVRKQDWDMLATNAKSGKETLAEFNIDNRWIEGPIPVHNVVAELKGTERPDEIVVVGGHLDSWNSPGSQGASDNGTGSCATLEAARLLIKSGLRPKRTIRFILFTGEEQGLLGSAEYVKQHAAELEKISVCIVDDGGSNYQNGVSGIAAWERFFAPSFALMTKNYPDMPMAFRTVEKYNGSGGSDQGSFWEKGVPAFFMGKAGTQNYGHIWHTQYDRYEDVIPKYLEQVSTNMAVMTFNIANMNSMLPRS